MRKTKGGSNRGMRRGHIEEQRWMRVDGSREGDRWGTSRGYENKEGELEDQSKVRNLREGRT